ncbi:hypothetical protein IE53DRAFT_382587 [Violaceomyces palustris]|uniref:Uncharacterized protein n=1 Tax=Violaceomyces palustris TaxID=1673888 RepID=A0ACD0NM23_9BASI|nr:hypothetical protein IE53DRAFT_382587 [Violaceomyces palustris]
MGKKKGAKKGGNDDFWDEAGESIEPNHNLKSAAIDEAVEEEQDDVVASSKKSNPSSRKNLFATMQLEDEPAEEEQEEQEQDQDFGGLMSAIKSSSSKKGKKEKKSKSKSKKQDDFDFDEFGEDLTGNANGDDREKAPPVQGGVDDMLDEEYPETNKKGNKKGGKNGKKAPASNRDEEEEEEEREEKVEKQVVEEDKDEEVDDGPKILTKKEKEKLKKEKEKAKKKAQAAAKKASSGATETPSTPKEEPKPEEPEPTPAADEDEAEEDEGGGGSSDKKKKKKKKKAAAPEPVAPPKKAPSAAVAALQARLAAQKKAEEEARAAEEEARRREEELERQEREEAERKEAERQRKKEKERLKKEQLKKEGKLLTPKQKAEKAAAEARLRAMLESGQVKVEGLEKSQEAAKETTKKKVVYENKKKKKGPQQRSGGLEVPAPVASAAATEEKAAVEAEVKEEKEAAEAAEAAEATTERLAQEVASLKVEEETRSAEDEEDIKDDWDAESEQEDVKDDWDAESEGEDDKKKEKDAAAATATSAAAPAQAKKSEAKKEAKVAEKAPSSKAAPAPAKPTASSAPAAKKAPAKKEESSSEGESGSDDDSDDSDDDSEDSDDGLTSTQKQAAERKAAAAERRKERTEKALAARNKDDLRSPICCILGHVDTGKTKLLDKVRQTNVQEGEAGGITQQIGATYFPIETLKTKTAVLDKNSAFEYKVPGLLVIDTPGHESFTNLRTRGSSLCNIAILVVDIMHGLEPQTLESIRLLRDKKTPFIVALNKIDRLYGWEATPDGAFQESLAKQNRATRSEFEDRVQKTILAFAEQGLNSCLYYENKNLGKNVSLVPTSAHTGEGIPDMLRLLVNLTQNRMSEKLMYLSELECTVLEVKVIEGLGTTIDVVLSNGVLREGDKIVVCGLNGPIVTQVRALLTPQPMKEMRVKGTYVHHKEVKAALGVKIAAPDLEKAISGSRLLVCGPDDDEEDLKDEVMSDLTGLLNSIDKSGRGVCVQASTLGSLEALLEFLRVSEIPVNGINIGPVYKKDVMRCATMLEKAKEFAVILCFDVPIDKEAERLAEELGVKIFSAKIIYHLQNDFVAYNEAVKEEKKRDAAGSAVWPCRLKTIAAFAKRDPIILGCDILEGTLRVGTPLCVVKTDATTRKKEIIHLGKVTSLEINHKAKEIVTKKEVGAGVAVKIEHAVYESAKAFGRHFDEKDEIVSHISRQSIDALKAHFWEGVSIDEKRLIKKLKGELDIP